jgi:UDP-N-acetylmuramyl pentapeptide synthase
MTNQNIAKEKCYLPNCLNLQQQNNNNNNKNFLPKCRSRMILSFDNRLETGSICPTNAQTTNRILFEIVFQTFSDKIDFEISGTFETLAALEVGLLVWSCGRG